MRLKLFRLTSLFANNHMSLNQGLLYVPFATFRELSLALVCSPMFGALIEIRLDRFAGGFSLWDALYFYVAAIGGCCIVVIAFIQFQRS